VRTTIELPDELMMRAKRRASALGISLHKFIIEAVERRLELDKTKVRKLPPLFGDKNLPKIGVLTAEQIEKAVFG
jgi:hypothetical protein